MSEQNQDGNQAGSSDAESRILELTAKVGELTALLNQRHVLDEQDREMRAAAEQSQQQNMGYDPNDPEVKEWAPWMAKKIAPFLAERDRAIVFLADKLDELETMRKFPEFEDEEFAKNVTKTIQRVQKEKGVRLTRLDAIRFLKGEEMISGKGRAPEGQEQVQVPQRTVRVNSPVESGPGMATTRAATPSNVQKDPNDMTIEEFEALNLRI